MGLRSHAAGSVRERSDCEAIVAAAVEQFGGVDVLVNNAQQVPIGPLDECTDDDMYTAWESGALAAFRLMQLCHPLMKAHGGGAIVNLGSGAGTEGLAGLGAYAVAKEGIRALTKVAMLEWGADNIRVNTICPWARSDHWDNLADRQTHGAAWPATRCDGSVIPRRTSVRSWCSWPATPGPTSPGRRSTSTGATWGSAE